MNSYLLTKIARLYYEEGYTQQEIANRLAISRPQISKLLKKARKQGIVKIEIIDKEEDFGVLEIKLSKKFSLNEVIIAPSLNDIKTALALKGSEYLKRILRDDLVISLSWGSTLRKLVDIADIRKNYKMEIIPIMGGMGNKGNKITSSEIARTLAEKTGGIYYVIHAPVIVKTAEMKEGLLKEEVIGEIFKKAKKADFAFVGIGKITDTSTMIREGYLEEKDFQLLKKENVIGDICATFFDIQGNVIDTELSKRIIGLDVRELKDSIVVGIGGGKEKREAILGALRGGFLDVLITDEETGLFLENS